MNHGLFGPQGPRRDSFVGGVTGGSASVSMGISGYYTIPLVFHVDIKDVPEGTTDEQAKELLEADAREVLEALKVLTGRSTSLFRFINVGPKSIQVGELVSFFDTD